MKTTLTGRTNVPRVLTLPERLAKMDRTSASLAFLPFVWAGFIPDFRKRPKIRVYTHVNRPEAAAYLLVFFVVFFWQNVSSNTFSRLFVEVFYRKSGVYFNLMHLFFFQTRMVPNKFTNPIFSFSVAMRTFY